MQVSFLSHWTPSSPPDKDLLLLNRSLSLSRISRAFLSLSLYPASEERRVGSGRVDGVDDRQASVVVWWCRLPTACGAEAVAECKVESFASGEREAVVSREG